VAGRRAPSAPRAQHRGRNQHFLRSPALADAVVRDAAVTADCVVVDVGAGSGRLTTPLAERAGQVYAIEVDPLLAARLRHRFAANANVTVVEGDARRVTLPRVPFRVVANLPFDGATSILRRLLDELLLERADVILEWGAARKRASCWPSTLLGVCWGARYEFVLVRRLPAACFEPRAAVDAGLLRIVRRRRALVDDPEYANFCAVVRAAFRHDRPLLAGLRGPACKRVARGLGLDRSSRPRDLDVHQWAVLFAAIRSGE
jgi:23S rRNA (adenine-N6)-dimethyltransferase